MTKVYEFPIKKQLPQEVKECLYEIADAYVKTLNYALTTLSEDTPTNAELNEIREMVEMTYLEGLVEAIDGMEP